MVSVDGCMDLLRLLINILIVSSNMQFIKERKADRFLLEVRMSSLSACFSFYQRNVDDAKQCATSGSVKTHDGEEERKKPRLLHLYL